MMREIRKNICLLYKMTDEVYTGCGILPFGLSAIAIGDDYVIAPHGCGPGTVELVREGKFAGCKVDFTKYTPRTQCKACPRESSHVQDSVCVRNEPCSPP